MMPTSNALRCVECHRPAGPLDWRCRHCGCYLILDQLAHFDVQAIERDKWSLVRYAAMLPVTPHLSLGEGGAPLTQVEVNGHKVWVKLEFMAPTGSYKDRGMVLLVSHLAQHGAQTVVEDSSGNAGVSLAAYAAKANLTAKIFVPEHASAAKKQQIATFGAQLITVPGPRRQATQACLAAQNGSAVYASHAWSPFFLAGQITCIWEVWEQFNRQLPPAIVFAVGQGSLLLGFWHGCRALRQAGLITAIPRLYGVQTTACDPVVRAWSSGVNEVTAVTDRPTVAEGIRVPRPVRDREVLAAIRASGGAAFHVDDQAILLAQNELAQQGIFVEPTSAAPVAALTMVRRHFERETEILIPLTGSGLKSMTVDTSP